MNKRLIIILSMAICLFSILSIINIKTWASENIAIDILGEHYTSLLDRFEILNEVVNEDGYILQYAGIGLDDLELYETE